MEYKEKNFISAVIYIYNSEARIEKFLSTIMETLEMNFEHSEIICVNDFSNDASVQIIKDVSKSAISTSISILNMSYFHGLEMSMNAGVDLAIGDFVLEFDTTVLDFDRNEILKIYHKSLEGYDIVSSSPDKKQKISSRLFYFIFDQFTNLTYEMNTESFRILSRRVINRVHSMNNSVPYRKVVYAHCGLKTDHMTYTAKHTIDKIGKQEKKYRKRLAIDTLILFTEVGYKFSITMTALMIVTTVIMAIYSAVTYMISTPVEGWTTTILFLSFSFFGLFGILTVVIKYLQIIVGLLFKRKKYSFEGIEKLTK